MRLRPGATLGPYQLVDRLGGGGGSDVWSARVSEGGELKALKIHLPSYPHDEQGEAMFRDEAELAVRLRHPNIVRTHGLLDIEGTLVQVMDVEEGIDLEAALRRLEGSLEPWFVGAFVIREIANAMSFAHGLDGPEGGLLGVVHRDLTPSNILLGWDGGVKVLDFGIAWTRGRRPRAQTELGVVKGKADYIAPEVARNLAFDHRADIYSLGVMAERVVLDAVEVRSRSSEPSRAGFAELVERMLASDPDQRPGSMRHVAERILEILRNESLDDISGRKALAETLGGLPGVPRMRPRGPPAQQTAVKPKPSVPRDATEVDLEASHPAGVPTGLLDLEETVVPTVAVAPAAEIGATTEPVPAPSLFPGLGDVVNEELRLVEAVDTNPLARVFRAEALRAPAPDRWVRFVALNPQETHFEEEAQRLSRLNSPRFLRVLGYGRQAPDLGFVVLEPVEADSLAEVLSAHPSRSLPHRLRVIREVAAALAEAHAYGVVHGHLDTGSVLVERATLAVRLDFARAPRLSTEPALSAAPSPEQKAGQPATMKTDLFLFGQLVDRAVGEEAKALKTQLLEVDPKRRPPNVVDVLLRLDEMLGDMTPLVVEPPTIPGGDIESETVSGIPPAETHSTVVPVGGPLTLDRAETPVDGPQTRVVSVSRLEPPPRGRLGRWVGAMGLGAVLVGLLLWSLGLIP